MVESVVSNEMSLDEDCIYVRVVLHEWSVRVLMVGHDFLSYKMVRFVSEVWYLRYVDLESFCYTVKDFFVFVNLYSLEIKFSIVLRCVDQNLYVLCLRVRDLLDLKLNLW